MFCLSCRGIGIRLLNPIPISARPSGGGWRITFGQSGTAQLGPRNGARIIQCLGVVTIFLGMERAGE